MIHVEARHRRSYYRRARGFPTRDQVFNTRLEAVEALSKWAEIVRKTDEVTQ